jgi:hypothetical protein
MKMKNTILLTILLLFIKVNIIAQTIYYNKVHNYSFSIPIGWKQISKSDCDDISKAMGTVTQLDAGFCPIKRTSTDWEVPIVCLLAEKQITKAEFEKVCQKTLKSFKSYVNSYYVQNKFGDIISNCKPGEGFYDKKNQFMVIMYSGEVNKKTVFTISTAYYTPKGILQIMCSEYQNNFKSMLNTYIKVLASLKK